jgi:hypothetical protein
MTRTKRLAVTLLAIGAACATARADVIEYKCGNSAASDLVLDYSDDGKTVTILNDGGKLVKKGTVLGRQSEQGINYLILGLDSRYDPAISLRLTGETRDKVMLKAGRYAMNCIRK